LRRTDRRELLSLKRLRLVDEGLTNWGHLQPPPV
jgi:hypothetical protein